MKTSAKGFMLVELLIAAAILVGTVLAFLILFYQSLILMEKNKNIIVAVDDARSILENIRGTEPFTPSNVTTGYPQGTDLSAKIGPKKLKNETIYVTYANPSVDPLTITATVNWQEKTAARSLSLVTVMTQR